MVNQLDRISPSLTGGPNQRAFNESLSSDLWNHEFAKLNRQGITNAAILPAHEFVLDIGRDALRHRLETRSALQQDAQDPRIDNTEAWVAESWRRDATLSQVVQTWKWRRHLRRDLRGGGLPDSMSQRPRSVVVADWLDGLGGDLGK